MSSRLHGSARTHRAWPALATGLTIGLWALPGLAGKADVIDARARCSARGACTFRVTVRHADQGWKHYADRWEVVGPDGAVLATRVLRHPHVGEQPFTRELAGVEIPAGIREVSVRARDSRHGHGGAEVRVEILRANAELR